LTADIGSGVKMARELIGSGAALERLRLLQQVAR